MSTTTIKVFPAPNNSRVKAVDLREMFESGDLSGRFRDWVRRVVIPYVGADKVSRYVPNESASRAKEWLVSKTVAKRIERNLLGSKDIRFRYSDEVKTRTRSRTKAKRTQSHTQAAPQKTSSPVCVDQLSEALSKMAEAMTLLGKSITAGTAGTDVPVGTQDVYLQSFKIDEQGFSNNNMYKDIPGSTKKAKTPEYNKWKAHAVKKIKRIKPSPALDLTRPMKVYMKMGHMPQFDTNNLTKSIIDALSEAWGFNDKLVMGHEIDGHHVRNWKDVSTEFFLKNVDR